MYNESDLKAGVAIEDITPPEGITGRVGIQNKMILKHELKVKALAFQYSDQSCIQLTYDLVMMTGRIADEICQRISAELGSSEDSIILTCTHTHSCPWVWDDQSIESEKYGIKCMDWDWREKIISSSVKAARKALGSVQSVVIKSGKAQAIDIASNRITNGLWRDSVCTDESIRNNEVGLIDPFVRVLGIFSQKDDVIAVICNYACHVTGYGSHKRVYVSPDFVLFAEKRISEHFGVFVPFFYWMGCAGNINVGKFNISGSDDDARGFGMRLANAVLEALDNNSQIKPDTNDLKILSKRLNLPVGDWIKPVDEARKIFEEKTREIKAMLDRDEIVPYDIVYPWRVAIKNLAVSIDGGSGYIDIKLRLLKFGDLYILFFPGEWFIQYALEMYRKNEGKNIWITTLSHGDIRYNPDISVDKSLYGASTDERLLSDEAILTMIDEAQKLIDDH